MSIKETWKLTDKLQENVWLGKYCHKKETSEQFINRVSGDNKLVGDLIRDRKFLFAGRILAHRGLHKEGKKITYSNCYVMPPAEDSIEDIFDTAKYLAKTYSQGGGCGVDISKLRPRGAEVNNSANYTSGAVSFMELYDVTTKLIGQNGRRGALMISLSDSHPDIEEFLDIKTMDGSITKANISVRITADFMEAVKSGSDWELSFVVEHTGEEIKKTVNARELFHKLAKNNWDWAEPGALFWDRITNWHMMSEHPNHEYVGVNPCAEEPLMAYGACLLGAINLSEFVVDPFTPLARFDIKGFKKAVRVGVIGLNDVLDEALTNNLYPMEEQRENAEKWRQIGLGVMGIADMLVKLGVTYGSEEGVSLNRLIARIMLNEALLQSSNLAKEEGSFPEFDLESLERSEFFKKSVDDDVKTLIRRNGLRNSQILTIAPTGSLSTMWGVSGGIEPMYSETYWRKTESLHEEDVFYEVQTEIVKEAIEANGGKKPECIVTSQTLNPRARIDTQSVWQEFVDAAISSTINLPKETTVEDVKDIYTYAFEKGLKGVTIFRNGCKRVGILSSDGEGDKEEEVEETLELENNAYAEDTKYEKCEECGAEIEVVAGACVICMNCGHSPCSS